MKDPIILVAEDSKYMRTVIGMTIKGMGYNSLFFAADGFETIEKAILLKPDIITLDITIPKINGLDVIPEILEVSPSSIIIMVTAMHNQDIIKQAIKSGASDFIHKPFQKETLENVIRSHVQKISV